MHTKKTPLLDRRGGTEEVSEAIRHRCRGGGFIYTKFNLKLIDSFLIPPPRHAIATLQPATPPVQEGNYVNGHQD